MRLTLDINVTFPGLPAFLSTLEGNIVTDIKQALNDSTDALVKKIEEANGKTDALIVIASTTKDALVALQAQAATAVISAADIQAVIDKQTLAVNALNDQEAQTDAAAAAVAP